MLTATHVGTSGAQLTTTATLSAPRVTSTVSSRTPPNATHSNPDVLWVQNASGHFVPVNADKHYQIADVVDDHSSLPDNLAQDSFIPVPAVSLHTSVPVESEAESDADIDTNKFLASSIQIYELIFQTLGEELCPRPVETSSNSTISITEQLVRTFDPTMVTKARSRLDTRLPIGTTVLSVFQSLESVNKTIPKRGDMWKVPKDFVESKLQELNYKPPVPDPTSGLDCSKLPSQDPDINKLLLTMPSSSTSVSVPFSMIEHSENRERRSLGLSNQVDLMLATLLHLVCDWSDSVPEELRDLLIHLSRTALSLSHNAAASCLRC
ncbi:hypothetical protein DPMN_015353 [Dreissena polymorpha]|uniref:Uncharacterized protein n=1 Tax=Dreissena polymorpha TaxID=45954 RepID=A0A9D4N8Z9_DREPO|nr:hypothetical protein DPMN_015353 [Dreissena polymorpha]